MPHETPGRSASATVPSAPPIPPLLPGRPPLAILVDYDGTISITDVSATILYALLGDELYAEQDAAYSDGILGSRSLFETQIKLLPGDPAPVVAIAEAQPHDPTFAPFVRRALELEIPIEVVSDGFGFFIEPALQRLGVPEIPVITARTTFEDGRAQMAFPNGHPDCLVCGTCKRQRVMAHQAAGRTVVFIGDGESDRYAAAYSDVIFAKRNLVTLCDEQGWAYLPWDSFDSVRVWLDLVAQAWDESGGLPEVTAPSGVILPVARERRFICGPELWGPGRLNPPGSR